MAYPPEQLTTFLAVLEEGTLDRAAIRLQVTPSAVSQRLKSLETAVGRVLVRRSKPVSPTEAGEVIARLARQSALLSAEAAAALAGSDPTGVESIPIHQRPSSSAPIPIVINADSLATWALAPLARLSTEHGLIFDLRREDEDHSVNLLRTGEVMAAVTSVAEPVPGCTVRRLGRLRYLLVCTPAFAEAWLPDGLNPTTLAHAPMVTFDHRDDLQHRYLRRRSRRPPRPPRHCVPSSAEFARAVTWSMGWGLLPEHDAEPLLATGELMMPDPTARVEVALFWQRWRLRSELLELITETMITAAAGTLR